MQWINSMTRQDKLSTLSMQCTRIDNTDAEDGGAAKTINWYSQHAVVNDDANNHTSHYGSQLSMTTMKDARDWKLIVRWQQSYQSLWITTTTTMKGRTEDKLILSDDNNHTSHYGSQSRQQWKENWKLNW